MEAYEYTIVDRAPFWIFFLALDTKLIQILPDLITIFLRQITFLAPGRFLFLTLKFFFFVKNLSIFI